MTERNLSGARQVYRSSSAVVGQDLYRDVLPSTRKLKRAVGYFSASCLSVARKEFSEFFLRGGRFYIVCSTQMYRSDVESILGGVIERGEWKKRFSENKLFDLYLRGEITDGEILSWLVANDYMYFKVAILSGKNNKSIYHEKIGVSCQNDGKVIAWTGSANESLNGLVRNFERIDVFDEYGDRSDRHRALAVQNQFDDLWNNKTDGLEVYDFIDAVKQKRLSVLEKSRAENGLEQDWLHDDSGLGLDMSVPAETIRPPEFIELFEHQNEAIEAWVANRGRGVLAMATGSGKTITALSLASRLWDAVDTTLVVLIVAPYIALVDQWIDVCRLFGLAPIKCAEGFRKWSEALDTSITSMKLGERNLLSICTTSATLQTEGFQAAIARVGRNCLVIADEVHNYGTALAIRSFPQNAMFRVGLSATPERRFDSEGTDRIVEYFGDVIYRFTLKDALDNGILTHYKYYPVFVDLLDKELEVYIELTHDLAKYMTGDDDAPISDAGMSLLIKRARLIGAAQKKIPLLRKLLLPYQAESHILVYCGDGRLESNDDGSWVRQIEEAVRVIGRELNMNCASFTANTSPERRSFILQEFERGTIQVLVAIRCLDEGIDIPATRTAFILASSSNPKQFVQRRGRLLRKADGKDRAEIYDFFVDPPHSYFPPGTAEYSVMQRLYISQIGRAREFIDLADNGVQARKAFRDITNYYALHTAWEESNSG